MNLKYKILWLDDKIDNYETSIVVKIKTHLEEQGFIPEIKTTDESKEFFKLLDNSFDLILTDYHLNETHGDEVIKEIRNQKIHTEILFYTAEANLKLESLIDRVSFLETTKSMDDHHKALRNKIKALIDLTIDKVQQVNNLRGLVMAETSDMDDLMLSLIRNYINAQRPSDLKNSICNRIKKSLNSKSKNIEKLCVKNDVEGIITSPSFDSSLKLRTLKEIITKIEGKEKAKAFYENYSNNILKKRNLLAHVKEFDENGVTILRSEHPSYDDVEFNAETCKEIRINLQEGKRYLDELSAKI